MTEPMVNEPRRSLDPVQPGQEEASAQGKWASRLVLFLRLLACLVLIKGLYHWAIVCGFDAPTLVGFDGYSTPFQSATVFFAVIDLVAAVGLWLAAPWGAVVWLTSAISMAAVEALFPQIYGGRLWVIGIEAVLLLIYLALALQSAREQPP
jgi:Family of unknown function (DUF6163)